MVSANDTLPNPIDQLGVPISDSELRETAYEILIGACRSSAGSKPLTYIPTERVTSLLTSGKGKTAGEIIRVQMRIDEATDSRIRKAFLRISSGQLGRQTELIVLPLELLQQLKPSDFPSAQEFETFQKRNLKILEAGLLLHPRVPLDKSDNNAHQLNQIIRGALDKPLETGKNNQTMQDLRNTVGSLTCRSDKDPTLNICHWADGSPLNLCLYQALLEACFEVDGETSLIDEVLVDEVIELIKKTWVILGMNQVLHNVCFSWVLLHRYVKTGLIDDSLLFAASNLLVEVEKDAKMTKETEHSKILSSILSIMLSWAEKQLLTYHETLAVSIELMESVVSLAVSCAKILVEDISHEYRRKRKDVDVGRDRVETYIRSSIRTAFAQKMENISLSKRSKTQQNPLPALSILAQEITELALTERDTYSPILKRWHPLAAGVAVATLHGCYANELKQFVDRINELTPETVLVLIATDHLENQLVQIAVEDSVDSDDGGKAIIKEMPPYDAQAVIATLVKTWIRTRIDRLKEWSERNLQQEVWNVQANKEHVAPSVIEMLRIMHETIEAFFLLPIPIQPAVVTELLSGLDKCLQQYAMKAKSGCGSGSSYIPSLPALTRCSAGPKFFKNKEKLQIPMMKNSQAESTNVEILRLCVKINTMQRIRSGVDALEKKTITYLKNSGSSDTDTQLRTKFELSISASLEGIQQLCVTTGYRVVFHNLRHVLWDGLYVGEISSSRIEPFLQEIEQYLEIMATTIHDRVKTRVITELMKASLDGFLLVLLAGGPSRRFTQQDSTMIEEDFEHLCDLFCSNGDGLPTELIDNLSKTIKTIFPLLQMDTKVLIKKFQDVTIENHGPSSKSRLPPTTCQWGPTDPNTLLRVLCYRNDEAAANFLKKTYNLPKKL